MGHNYKNIIKRTKPESRPAKGIEIEILANTFLVTFLHHNSTTVDSKNKLLETGVHVSVNQSN